MSSPPPDLKARVLSAALAKPAPTRADHLRQASLMVFVAFAISVTVFFLAGGIRITGRPMSLVIGSSVGTGLTATFALFTVFGRRTSTAGRPTIWLLIAGIGSPIAMLAWKLAWSAQFEDGLAQWPSRMGMRCFNLSLLVGVLPLGALIFARRGTDPTHPRVLGFAIGMAIGLFAADLVDLWCPVAYLPHLLLGHVLPAALLGMAGSLLGAKVLSPSER